MPVGSARQRSLVLTFARGGLRAGLAATFLLAGIDSLQNAIAEGDTRTISFHHVHTGEDISITYKRNGRYDEAALKKLDWFMRDWRKEQEVHMDPHLFDLLWEVNREVNGTQPIDVICGYRSPGTNAMLRARTTGVAQFSQHTHGQAIDFFIPGVPLSEIRKVGLRLQRGGVGFYPTSGSPFVHLDTGTIRHWPRMTREQLVKVFPDGRTVHIPTDGQPLPGYALALAEVERHGSVPSGKSLEAARYAGVISDRDIQVAEIKAETKPKRSLLASLFGIGKDAEDESEQEPAAPRHSRAPVEIASVTRPVHVATERIVPLPNARPKPMMVAAATPLPMPRPMAVASLAGARGNSPKAVEASALPAAIEVADADPIATAALAYAPEEHERPVTRARPMGSSMPHAPSASLLAPASNTTVIAKQSVQGGPIRSEPWLRATMLTPNVSYMTATRLGTPDTRALADLMRKPSSALAMAFSADPQPGLTAGRFSGEAVVFLATRTFDNRTASLR
ncbi:MAG TPA: DUF882 domain-containing protein [Pseudolabrys sp.]|nr:DUF882 domain-containing protein [Pseudolabrys sp.]